MGSSRIEEQVARPWNTTGQRSPVGRSSYGPAGERHRRPEGGRVPPGPGGRQLRPHENSAGPALPAAQVRSTSAGTTTWNSNPG